MKMTNFLKKSIPILALVFLSFTAFSQNITIEGQVTDAETGEPLPGVSIVEKGTQNGTSTDMDGNYQISVPDDATLVFSFVGYQAQEVPVDGRTTLNVQLQQQVQEMEEVVVIGYGQVRKEDATGSVSKLTSDDFEEGAITSPEQLLSGKATGVQITSGGGAPGSGTTIRIRGGSSMSASNAPLIVIDGIPIDNQSISGMRNPLNTLNPGDIESFTVLKDASATAIYGSRASNGVILIETKEGSVDRPMQVSYQGKVSLDTRTNEIDVLGANDYKTLFQDYFADNQNALDLLGDDNTDWQEQIFDPAVSHDHNLSVSGAAGGVPYRASIGYNNSNGILKTSNMERTTASITANPSFFDDRLEVDANLKGLYIENRFANDGAIGAAVAFDPTQPVKMQNPGTMDDGTEINNGYHTWLDNSGDPIPIATDNPLAMLNLEQDRSFVKRSLGNVKFDYDVHGLPGLTATLNMGYDYSESDGYVFVPVQASWEYDEQNGGGVDRDYGQTKRNELLDFYLNYQTDLEELDSRLSLMGGYSWQHFWRKGFTYQTNVAKTITDEDTDYKTENYLVSFFGRLNYTFKEKYLLTATLRRDGSSRFAEDNRWGLFPSAALAWQIHKEPFLENVDAINELKLRVGYGVTGQQDITDNDYPYLARYTVSENTARYMFGNQWINTIRPEGYDENIKWEETTTYNAALDYSLLDNRIYGNLEFYYKETEDMINTVPVPAGTNFTNRIVTNIGSMKNQGFEFSVNGVAISQEDFSWEIGLNATYNENEITKLTSANDPSYQGVETGGIAGGVGNNIQIHSTGYPRNAFFVYEQVYNQDGDPVEGVYVDRNGDGQITNEDKYRYKQAAPTVYGGFSTRLNYKNWDFRFSGRVNIGNYVYNNIESNNNVLNQMYFSAGYLTNVTQEIYNTRFRNTQYMSDYYVRDASFLRMDNISLGYTFRDVMNQQSNVRVYTTVQNAFVITPYEGLDPEIESGIDNNFYPRPTTFVLGVSANF
jgi:iron complex outermembrane receptor protein